MLGCDGLVLSHEWMRFECLEDCWICKRKDYNKRADGEPRQEMKRLGMSECKDARNKELVGNSRELERAEETSERDQDSVRGVEPMMMMI
jgi:hypothetical protein